jgi:hypothetical protein
MTETRNHLAGADGVWSFTIGGIEVHRTGVDK